MTTHQEPPANAPTAVACTKAPPPALAKLPAAIPAKSPAMIPAISAKNRQTFPAIAPATPYHAPGPMLGIFRASLLRHSLLHDIPEIPTTIPATSPAIISAISRNLKPYANRSQRDAHAPGKNSGNIPAISATSLAAPRHHSNLHHKPARPLRQYTPTPTPATFRQYRQKIGNSSGNSFPRYPESSLSY